MTERVNRKTEIAQHWARHFHLDLGEPCCFACRYYLPRWDAGKLSTRWDKTPLQVCHLVPKSLGGNDEISNLVLLCTRCHDEAPDTNDPNRMLSWMKNRPSHLARLFDDLRKELSPQEIQAIADMHPMELKGRMDLIKASRFGLHFDGNRVGLSVGTWAEILRAALAEDWQ